jgi:hypothetical protein
MVSDTPRRESAQSGSRSGRWKLGLALLAPIALLSACGVSSSGSSGTALGALPAPRTYGAGEQKFAIAFPSTPSATSTTPTSTSTTMVGPPTLAASVGTTRGEIWSGGGVIVRVISLARPLAPQRVDPYLRSYLPSTQGGRIVTFDGLPAAMGVYRCFTPAGSCPGDVAGLEVLSGHTLFDIFSNGYDRSSTERILTTFRVV